MQHCPVFNHIYRGLHYSHRFPFCACPFCSRGDAVAGGAISGKGFDDIHFMFMGKNEWGDLKLAEMESEDGLLAHRHSETGGIITFLADVITRAQKTSAALGGYNVHYFAFASDGFLLDVGKAAVRSFGIPLPGDHEFADFNTRIIDSGGGPEKCILHSKVHSQGAIVTDNLRGQIGERYCKSIDVYAFGGGKILDTRNFYSATNYISPRDPVPWSEILSSISPHYLGREAMLSFWRPGDFLLWIIVLMAMLIKMQMMMPTVESKKN